MRQCTFTIKQPKPILISTKLKVGRCQVVLTCATRTQNYSNRPSRIFYLKNSNTLLLPLSQVLFKLRGFPKKEKIAETHFTLVGESSNSSGKEFRFQGMGGILDIAYSKERLAWELRATDSGSMLMDLDKLPIGFHMWKTNSGMTQYLNLAKVRRREHIEAEFHDCIGKAI